MVEKFYLFLNLMEKGSRKNPGDYSRANISLWALDARNKDNKYLVTVFRKGRETLKVLVIHLLHTKMVIFLLLIWG